MRKNEKKAVQQASQRNASVNSPIVHRKLWHRIRRLAEVHVFERLRNVSGFVKVLLILTVASLLFLWCGYQFGGRHGLLAGFIGALALNLIVFLYTAKLLHLFSGKEIVGRDPWGLLADVDDLCRRIGIRAPKVIIIETRTPVVYSCGLFSGQFHLMISSGLIESFSAEERKAVVAFELNKIRNHITASATAATALASCVQAIGNLLDFTVFLPLFLITHNRARNGRRRPVRLGLALVAPLIGFINRLAVSKERLLEIDRRTTETLMQGSSLESARMSLAAALFKLECYAQTRPVRVRICDTPLFAVSPLTSIDVTPYLNIHPKLEQRLLQLVGRKRIY